MQKKIVVLQPQFIPWRGVFEQIKLSEVYVFYDDVQLPFGRSFINRVQIKTSNGIRWLTVPLHRVGTQIIKDVTIDNSQNWQEKHLKTLKNNYAKAPFFHEMIEIMESLYNREIDYIAELNICFIESIMKYFAIDNKKILRSSNINNILGNKSERLIQIIKTFNGTEYITGHGAKNYLDHEEFERNNISVFYMDYKNSPYEQLHGEFTPYVSIIDLIANCGQDGIDYINSNTKHWKEVLKGENRC